MPFVMVMHVMVTCALKPVESKVEGCAVAELILVAVQFLVAKRPVADR